MSISRTPRGQGSLFPAAAAAAAFPLKEGSKAVEQEAQNQAQGCAVVYTRMQLYFCDSTGNTKVSLSSGAGATSLVTTAFLTTNYLAIYNR